MTEKEEVSKESLSSDGVFKDPASPRSHNRTTKSKYQAFRSDDDESSEEEDTGDVIRTGKKRSVKKEKSSSTTSFKKKIVKGSKKKEVEKEKQVTEKEKQKRAKDREKQEKKDKRKSKASSTVFSGDESSERVEPPLHGPVFGVNLETAVFRSKLPDGIMLPRIVRECICYVEDKGLDYEGVYRVSGIRSRMDQLKIAYNEGREVLLEDEDPNVMAGLLKLYLREMPSSVLTTRLAPIFEACVALDDEDEQVHRFQQLVNDLPVPNKTLLAWLFVHFRNIIDRGSETKMNIQNLSIVFSPTMGISHGVLNIFFTHIDKIFPNTSIIRYVKMEIKDPNTIEDWQEVLMRDEATLAALHEQVNHVQDEDEELHEELWEMQRKVTQIKRKIKTLRREQIMYVRSTEDIPSQTQLQDSTAAVSISDITVSTSEEVVQVDVHTSSRTDVEGEKNVNNHVNNHASTLLEVANSLNAEEDVPVETSEGPGWSADDLISSSEQVPPQEVDSSHVDNSPNAEGEHELPSESVIVYEDHSSVTEAEPPILEHEDDVIADEPETEVYAEVVANDSIVSTSSNDVFNDTCEEDEEEEIRLLLIEEQRLLIEREELQLIGDGWRKKIQREQVAIERLELQLVNYEAEKSASSSMSSSMSSSSSSSSIASSSGSRESRSEEDYEAECCELEIILNEIEKENEMLKNESQEWMTKIGDEHAHIVKLKTQLRMMDLDEKYAATI